MDEKFLSVISVLSTIVRISIRAYKSSIFIVIIIIYINIIIIKIILQDVRLVFFVKQIIARNEITEIIEIFFSKVNELLYYLF